MAELKGVLFFLLRYCGDVTKRESINLGVIAMSPEEEPDGFADVRFTTNWRRLRCFDPLVDVEELQAVQTEIRQQLLDGQKRPELLKRISDSYSGLLQSDFLCGCLSDSPATEIEKISALYLNTPEPLEKRELSGRQRIVRAMEQEFEQRGILGRMERGFAVAEFTRAGDPLKLDFGYRLGTNFKFLHAVSLAQRSDRAMLLAARFPQIASGMKAKKGVTPWLTAVVDDELPKREEVDFALDMMQENGIVVASAAEMPRIAEGIRLELRA